MSDPHAHIPSSSILERTEAGRRELLSRSVRLSGRERRMLAIVNGFKPLANLWHMLDGQEDAQAGIDRLLSLGLVKVQTPIAVPRQAAWGQRDGAGRSARAGN